MIKNILDKNKENEKRLISQCPEAFEKLLNIINSLPPDARKRHRQLEREFNKEKRTLLQLRKKKEATAEQNLQYLNLGEKYEKKIKEEFGEEIYLYCINLIDTEINPAFGDFSGNMGTIDGLFKLSEIVEMRQVLADFADANLEHFSEFIAARPFHSEFTSRITIGISSDGIIKPVANALFEILRVLRIPIERIRQCAICKKIYWAARLEKNTQTAPACPAQCSSKYHKAVSRIKGYRKALEVEEKILTKILADPKTNESNKAKQTNIVRKLLFNLVKNELMLQKRLKPEGNLREWSINNLRELLETLDYYNLRGK